jgi:hypothetical protein
MQHAAKVTKYFAITDCSIAANFDRQHQRPAVVRSMEDAKGKNCRQQLQLLVNRDK